MTLKELLARPYTKVVRRDVDGDVVARVVELPGCIAHGRTDAEALDRLAEVQALWLEDALEAGDQIPDPLPDEPTLPSGRWVQRVPRTLHQALTVRARTEGVSLNQLVTTILSNAVGQGQLIDVLDRVRRQLDDQIAWVQQIQARWHQHWQLLSGQPQSTSHVGVLMSSLTPTASHVGPQEGEFDVTIYQGVHGLPATGRARRY